ncbi:MAG: hypothetical protein DRO94_04315 [Candidatus Altiarchaeales archaeon]|nr:MAG: hypothetical protein DRO94_04315 [Candidatus Altiarchaeales archaeon]HDO82780.1 CBS domain-containing protein [Candidatus Altiarchaeales archaeon]HEX55429.1 CBS domain-containing protein [Candidatus Altiarchaeales archaeon]
MRSSYKIFRIFGIDVELHISFILIFIFTLSLISLYGLSKEEGPLSIISGVHYGSRVIALFVLLFGIVLMHELAHSLVAIRNKIDVKRIILTPIGGIANIDVPENPEVELKTSIIGPLSNYIVVIILLPLVIIMWPEYLIPSNLYRYVLINNVFGDIFSIPEVFLIIITLNLLLGSFNLIPAFPMDGGRVLRSVLALWTDYVDATVMAVRISQFLAIIMLLVGMLMSFVLVIISIFILITGSNELKIVKLRHAFQGVRVGSIANRNFSYVNKNLTAHEFLRMIATPTQAYYPVVDDGRVIGILRIEDLRGIKSDDLKRITVGKLISRRFDIIDAGKIASEVIPQLLSKEFVIVVDSGRMIGYIDPERILEMANFYNICRLK